MDAMPENPGKLLHWIDVIGPLKVSIKFVTAQPPGGGVSMHSEANICELARIKYPLGFSTKSMVRFVTGTVKVIMPPSPSLKSPPAKPVPSAKLKVTRLKGVAVAPVSSVTDDMTVLPSGIMISPSWKVRVSALTQTAKHRRAKIAKSTLRIVFSNRPIGPGRAGYIRKT